MNLIKPSVEFWKQGDHVQGLYEHIERCARICYRSANKGNVTAEQFVKSLIKRRHCYTGDSEVLTEKGWIKWSNYSGEKVAVASSKTMSFVGFEKPKEIFRHTYKGKFYEYPELGIKVTDGHRMFGMHQSDWVNNKRMFKPKLFVCNEEYFDPNNRRWTLGERMFRVPTACRYVAQELNPIFQLIGFWLGDGYKKVTNNTINFHLKKKRKIDYLKSLCQKLNIELHSYSNKYVIHSNVISALIKTICIKDGEKYFDATLNSTDIKSVIDGLINSDGAQEHHNISFYNTNNSIIEWIKRNGVLCGYNISEIKPVKQHPICRVLLIKKYDSKLVNDSRRQKSEVIISEEELPVYCVSVSTGVIIVRGTSGQTLLCGNCRPLEFGTLCFSFGTFPDWNEKVESPWFKECNGWLVTNLRWLIEHAPFNWEMYVMISDQQGGLNPNLTNYYRPTFHWNISRGIGDEFRTHVTLSSLMESTRYVNYHRVGKDGMKNLNDKNNHMDFVIPSWYNPNNNDGILERTWVKAEDTYSEMIEKGYKPQQAREVLPLSIATNLVQCGFRDAWENFFNLRCDKAAHPDSIYISSRAIAMFNYYQK